MNTPVPPMRGPNGEVVGSPTYAAPAVAPAVASTVVGNADDSAVSWAAILAGAAAAAALSMILVMLGAGLGLASVSPWSYEGVSAETFGWATIGWISFTAFAASGLGGYLAGRLRRRWISVPGDETYFRDTAHGFLSWAVATLLTAALLTSTIAGMLGAGARAGAAVAGTAATTAAGGIAAAGAALTGGDERTGTIEYYVDSLLRPDVSRAPAPASVPAPDAAVAPDDSAADPNALTTAPAAPRAPAAGTGNGSNADTEALRAQAVRIMLQSLRSGELADDDTRYLGQLVAERTGLDQQAAQARVTELHGRLVTTLDEAETAARETADEAREAAAYASLWLFITLLLGAFAASLFATFGGRQRDA
jgi:hypothetical protein